MANQAPFELQVGVLAVYIGPVGEADPGADTGTPAGGWVAVGDTEGGISLAENRTTVTIGEDTTTHAEKVVTTEHIPTLAFSLANMTLEKLAKFMSDLTVTDIAAGGGTKGYRHFTVNELDDDQFAILLQNSTNSPYMSDLYRILVYRCAVSAMGDRAYVKGDKTVLPVTLTVLNDTSTPGNLYKIYAVDAAAA